MPPTQALDTMYSDPWPAELSALTGKFSADEHKEKLRAVRAGELTELTIDIIAFRAVYPNSNFMRFRDGDLPRFASSFAQQPFLRNHDVWDIGARDGTIVASSLSGQDFRQTLRITTQRGLEDLLQGRIDRFSIGWYYEDIHCSICNAPWLECEHWPGRKYKGPAKEDPEHLCELIFINPTGKETQRVNAPAVKGTRVLAAADEHSFAHLADPLARLCELKLQHQKEVQAQLARQPTAAPTPPVTTPPAAPTPALEQTAEPEPPCHEDPMDNDTTQQVEHSPPPPPPARLPPARAGAPPTRLLSPRRRR